MDKVIKIDSNSSSVSYPAKVLSTAVMTALTPQEAKIVRASTAPKMKDISDDEMYQMVKDELGVAIVVLGHSPKDDKSLSVMIDAICLDLANKFPNTTVDEFRQAMNLGARGEFKTRPDEVLMVSISSVYQWVKSYNLKLQREAVFKAKTMERKQDEPQLSEEDKLKVIEEVNLQILEAEFRDLDKEVYRASIGARVYRFENLYNFLQSKGLLNPSEDDRVSAYQESISILRSKTDKSELLRNERYHFDQMISSEFISLPRKEKKLNIYHTDLVKLAKEVLVTRFLQELKEIGIEDVKDFLSER